LELQLYAGLELSFLIEQHLTIKFEKVDLTALVNSTGLIFELLVSVHILKQCIGLLHIYSFERPAAEQLVAPFLRTLCFSWCIFADVFLLMHDSCVQETSCISVGYICHFITPYTETRKWTWRKLSAQCSSHPVL